MNTKTNSPDHVRPEESLEEMKKLWGEACLSANPEHASELAPLLRAAALLADAPRQGPSSEASALGARRLAAAVELKRSQNGGHLGCRAAGILNLDGHEWARIGCC